MELAAAGALSQQRWYLALQVHCHSKDGTWCCRCTVTAEMVLGAAGALSQQRWYLVLQVILTRGGDLLLQALYMSAVLEVLPDLQPGGRWVQQVGDDLLVDLKEAASADELHLPPRPLLHAAHTLRRRKIHVELNHSNIKHLCMSWRHTQIHAICCAEVCAS